MAAAQGHPQARLALGVLLAYHKGPLHDPVEAALWITSAADLGDPVAHFALGMMYVHGEGVPKDAAEAVNWMSKAAGQGHTQAQSTLRGLSIANPET
jgi:uncharacterized protein